MEEERKIPVTSMTKLYWDVHSSQEERLALATEYVDRPNILAEKFNETRTQFENEFVSWSEFPFHTRTDPLDFVAGATPVKRTRDLAAALLQKTEEGKPVGEKWPALWHVSGAPELSFYYLDREIQPARTDVETQFEDVESAPEQAPKKLSLDLLLANAEDRIPIVCEVKLTTERDEDGKIRLSADKDPFFALVQVLTSTAHLASRPQRQRLKDNYDVNVDDGRFDVYVMVRGRPAEDAKYWFRILEKSKVLAARFLKQPGIDEVIRRIEFLDLEAKQGFETKEDTDLNPWFGYPDLDGPPEFTLSFSRL